LLSFTGSWKITHAAEECFLAFSCEVTSLQLDFRTKDILFYNMKLVLVRRLLFLMYFLLENTLK
jgi:hypothetical protein